jgi:hypothetical protein
MSFLAPLFFLGLAAIAAPVIIHMIQRERKEVIYFPSLMFLKQIPYSSVQRRRVHNWLLLALRCLAILLLVAAFSRPFFTQDPTRLVAAASGAREVVILLDRSASMGYADRWDKARAEAQTVVSGIGGDDRATLVLFATGEEEAVRATSDRSALEMAIRDATVSADGTRYGPALRYAQSLLSRSMLPRKEAVLISDFQKTGWEQREEVRLPEGATLTPISVATPGTANVSVTKAEFAREPFANGEKVAVTVLVTNRAPTPVAALPVKLEVDGHEMETRTLNLEANTSGSVTFQPVTLADANMRGVVRAGTDQLAIDNAFFFVLSPTRPVSVLQLVADGASSQASLYLTTALEQGHAPDFKTETLPISRLTSAVLQDRSVVVLNDIGSISTASDTLLKQFVEQGGGLFIALGDRTPWGSAGSPLLPGTLGAMVDRSGPPKATFGQIEYSHPIFELFKQPRNGNFTDAQFDRFRMLTPAATDHTLARFDDGRAAIVERRVGAGRVIAFTSTLDRSWNTFPVTSVFVPVTHLAFRYLAQYDDPAAWHTVGRMLDVSAPIGQIVREGGVANAKTAPRKSTGVVMAPSGQQTTLGDGGVAAVRLEEQGFYTTRMQGTGDRRPFAVAVNLDPAESDLTPMEAVQFATSATGGGAVTPSGQSLEHPELTPADIEKKQNVWWILLLAGVMALVAEAILSNRLSRRFGAGLLQGQPALAQAPAGQARRH